MSKTYCVYILASRSRALYVGVTNNLTRRVFEHREHMAAGHTVWYRITRLVHFGATNDVHGAIAREKQIKGWRREKRVALIEAANPTWEDLAGDWYGADSQEKTLSFRTKRGICCRAG